MEKGEFNPGGTRGLVLKMLVGPGLSTNWSTDVASERLGAGETELLEEGDLGGGCCVGVAVEFLVGWFGRGRMPWGAEL